MKNPTLQIGSIYTVTGGGNLEGLVGKLISDHKLYFPEIDEERSFLGSLNKLRSASDKEKIRFLIALSNVNLNN